jgi:formamidase
MQTRHAFDGQITPTTVASDLLGTDLGLVHPLTGPVFVKGAEPGDLLEVTIQRIEPAHWGFTSILPGFGFLRDVFTEPYLVHWEMNDGFARSEQLPGVRIPEASFMGTIGVAPSRALRQEILLREDELLRRGGMVVGPTPEGAVPAQEPFAVRVSGPFRLENTAETWILNSSPLELD